MYNFEKTFIRDSRWKLFLEGFGNTLLIALCSTLLGVLIGMVIAVVKVLHAQMDRPNILVNIFNFIFNIYTTVIRGTPAVVQLFIAYYIIFKNTDNYVLVSIFAFGINSGAYVSEIVRGGILSIDRGQLEAGRSLGLSYITTMMFVVIPQAVKNILPSLGNEFILLLKDTSIAGYIGTLELTKAGNIVRSRTFEPYFSLLSVAAIYLVCVILLEQLIKYFERRMSKSDRH
ncbi:MAG: amino acid ABC transporter permease [Ruminococcaceae bacterium]|nr:amino acid ABC transporter permease [Oscillospiraceae bacterium]